MADIAELRSIRIFLMVCETLNMTEAARRLGLSQSAVSHSVSALERNVGTPLFDRHMRPMSLTPAGFALFEAAQRIDTSFAGFQSTIAKVKAGKIAHLRIGLTSSLPGTLTPLFISTVGEYVERVTIRTGLTPELRAALVSGDIDLSVMIDRPQDAALASHEVLKEPYIIAAPLRMGPIETLAQLSELAQKLPFARWIGGHMGRDIEAHLSRLKIAPPERLGLDDRNAVMHTIDAGLAWAVITPLSAYDAWRASSNIRLQPFPGAKFQHSLVAAHKPGQFEAMARLCVDSLRQAISARVIPEFSARVPWLSQTMIAWNDDLSSPE